MTQRENLAQVWTDYKENHTIYLRYPIYMYVF